ncbi:MAG: 2-oxoglutarate dehydrogenase complex dihydrolipoyllysine-residue succinyltransferase [Bacteroidota bacterium]|nr:MAG: 2-oxoglutarate dehydrogenase complex dihydrolipoyllysine-residue succinyltransferase [Bacteroidota bacterium]
MIVEIKIPSPGESISEVEITQWLVANGDYVQKDQELAEIESDKATLPLLAAEAGSIKILAETGKSVAVGSVACTIDTTAAATPASPAAKTKKQEPVADKSKSVIVSEAITVSQSQPVAESSHTKVTPLAKKIMQENNLSIDDVVKGLRKISKSDIENLIEQSTNPTKGSGEIKRELSRERMSALRRKLSQRLVAVKNETAMLTTFNEVDMTAIMDLRQKYQKNFVDKYGIKLGFMSFFTRACAIALQRFPKINSYLEGDEMVMPNYVDIAIAVQTDKGLMVPVLRNVESLGIAETELLIAQMAQKARSFKITPEEMSGGTFTITNGGVFGSLLSTPILNPPQSGILGMHNIVDRPIAFNGQVVIRPMMYIALSYDHRLVDGRDSVSFLVAVKEMLESPQTMLLAGKNPETLLLGL